MIGPNLPGPDTFHAHAAECKDLERGIYPRLVGPSNDVWLDIIECETRRDVAEFIYPVGEFEYWDTDPDAYIDDIKFFPCLRGLRGVDTACVEGR